MPTPPAPTKVFRREIELDFIRGIAILMVLDDHAQVRLLSFPFYLLGFQPFGWVGVNLFFVLSGFLVGGLLIRERQIRHQVAGGEFLIRRAFKIWPQYYVYLGVMLLAGHRTLSQLWGNLLNIQNYTGGIAHTWSLAVEEHAYLLLTLILGVTGWLSTSMKNLFILLACLSASVMALRLALAERGVNVYYTTHTRIDGIFDGVLLAILYHHTPETFRRIQSRYWPWLLTLGCTLIYFRIRPQTDWAQAVNIDMGNLMGIALLMIFYRHREGKLRAIGYRFVAWIGIYSYGIYLWHVSVGAPVITPIAQKLSPVPAAIWSALAVLILPVALGVFFTKLVEFPCLRLREYLFPRRVDSAVAV